MTPLDPRPIILVRGFGGVNRSDEQELAYQGFNVGTVYDHKRGENYIYEGMALKLIKSKWRYHDATNVIGYYSRDQQALDDARPEILQSLPDSHFAGNPVIIDQGCAAKLLASGQDMRRTFWVFRYYDLKDRTFTQYSEALTRTIMLVQDLVKLQTGGEKTSVNVIAHSMGGLILRQALQVEYGSKEAAHAAINKVVTLGTPHQGISFQVMRYLNWLPLDVSEELEQFNPKNQMNGRRKRSFKKLKNVFDLDRLLCVAGTDYRNYMWISSMANRLAPFRGEGGLLYNKSDGLVKHSSARVPGAHATYVDKCHGGRDSLMSARESFEIAMRFFHGNLRMRINLQKARVKGSHDWFGQDEVYFGLSVKPRNLDFDLHHQSKRAENCYGPFHKSDLTDKAPRDDWAGPDRLIWQGFLDGSASVSGDDIVLRLEFYVSERDRTGLGFSDTVLLSQQVVLQLRDDDDGPGMYSHARMPRMNRGADEQADATKLTRGADGTWQLRVHNGMFDCTLGLTVTHLDDAGAEVNLSGPVSALIG